jgi:hypothetical protein
MVVTAHATRSMMHNQLHLRVPDYPVASARVVAVSCPITSEATVLMWNGGSPTVLPAPRAQCSIQARP